MDRCEIETSGILHFGKDVLWKPTDVQRVDFITDLKSYRKNKDNLDDLIPYWRMISLKGTQIDFGCYFDKEKRRKTYWNRRAMSSPAQPQQAGVPGGELQNGVL